jgi:hypothetical protein
MRLAVVVVVVVAVLLMLLLLPSFRISKAGGHLLAVAPRTMYGVRLYPEVHIAAKRTREARGPMVTTNFRTRW